jgi:lysozyme
MKLHRISRFYALATALLAGPGTAGAAEQDGITLSGIDVSHFQGEIDWQKVGGEKLHFVYIKASEGLHTTDARLVENWQGARQNGLRTGAYHFFHPGEDPVEQAKHFLAQLDAANISLAGALPPVLDIEIAEGTKADGLREDIMRWLRHVEEATGCRPVLYTSPRFWDKEEAGSFAAHHLWVADYAPTPTVPDGWKRWTFWQHSQDGTVSGISKKVDLTLFAGNEVSLEEISCGVR